MVFSSHEGDGSSQRVSTMLLCERGYKQLDEADTILRPWCFLGEGPSYTTIKLGMLYREIDQMTEAELEEINLATKTLLNELGVPYDDLEPDRIDPLEKKRIDRNAKLWRSKAYVDEFKEKMKQIALEMLAVNEKAIATEKAKYKSYFYGHGSARESNKVYDRLKDAILADYQFSEYERIAKEYADLNYTSYNHSIPGVERVPWPMTIDGENWDFYAYYETQVAAVQFYGELRRALRATYPVMDVLNEGDVSHKSSATEAYEKIEKGLDAAKKAIGEVRAKIEDGSMRLYKLPYVVQQALAFFKINETSKDERSVAVKAYLAKEMGTDFWIQVTGTALGLMGAVAALFIPGVGLTAAIILGCVAGAGTVGGGVLSLYELEVASQLDAAGRSQRGGIFKLIDDPDLAREEYLWSIVGLALAAIDMVTTAADMVRIVKVLGYFDTVKDACVFSKRVGKKFDDTVRFAKAMDKAADGRKIFELLSLAKKEEDVVAITRFFAGLDEFDPDAIRKAEALFKRFDKVEDFAKRIRAESMIDDVGALAGEHTPFEVMKRYDATGSRIELSQLGKRVSKPSIYKREMIFGVDEDTLNALIEATKKTAEQFKLEEFESCVRPRAYGATAGDALGQPSKYMGAKNVIGIPKGWKLVKRSDGIIEIVPTSFKGGDAVKIPSLPDGYRIVPVKEGDGYIVVTSDLDAAYFKSDGRYLYTKEKAGELTGELTDDYKMYKYFSEELNDSYRSTGSLTDIMLHPDNISGQLEKIAGAFAAAQKDDLCLVIRYRKGKITITEVNYSVFERQAIR